MKIIVFPFAGGNKFSFNNFFSKNVNFVVFEYPGRGLRVKENLFENINELVNDLLEKVKEEIENTEEEYLIYGHSMGALVGYLICKKIDELFIKKPIRLVVSGRKAPKYDIKHIDTSLPKTFFWDQVNDLGGIPFEIYKNLEMIDYFVPILRADFKCIEKYKHNQDSKKITIPIDVFYGINEDITQETAMSWQEESTQKVRVKALKGGHFFIFENKCFFDVYFKNFQIQTKYLN